MSCEYPGCTKPLKPNRTTGYCEGHARQVSRGTGLKPLHHKRLVGPCLIKGCQMTVVCRNMCGTHYHLVTGATVAAPHQRSCLVPGCKLRHYAKDMCYAHYNASYNMKKYADVIEMLQRKDEMNDQT